MVDQEKKLTKAKDLLAALEHHDAEVACSLIAELSEGEKGTLYQEIGSLTRELHTELTDVGIKGVTEQIPDTKQRLNRVIEVMEAAANRTIEQIESTMPLPEALAKIAGHLVREGQKLETKEMKPADFPIYYQSMMFFLNSVVDNSETMRMKLREIVVAQDFQDLTGQSLVKVMNAVEDLEDRLVELLRHASQVFKFEDIHAFKTRMDEDLEDISPEISMEAKDTVKGQDDVDSLLDELGF